MNDAVFESRVFPNDMKEQYARYLEANYLSTRSLESAKYESVRYLEFQGWTIDHAGDCGFSISGASAHIQCVESYDDGVQFGRLIESDKVTKNVFATSNIHDDDVVSEPYFGNLCSNFDGFEIW